MGQKMFISIYTTSYSLVNTFHKVSDNTQKITMITNVILIFYNSLINKLI